MATLETNDPNILDAETVNWRAVVLPVAAALVIILAGVIYYYYQQAQREALESTAREALLKAATPADMIKVADQYPHTDQQILALFGAADASFTAHDFGAATTAYQRIMDTAAVDPELRDSAELGLASAQEAMAKPDDALKSYLDVAHRGAKSPYAAFAYNSAARIYEGRGDKLNEGEVLGEAAGLDPDLPSVKEAQARLKQLSVSRQPALPIPAAAPPAPAPAPSAAAPAASVPAQPAPVPPKKN